MALLLELLHITFMLHVIHVTICSTILQDGLYNIIYNIIINCAYRIDKELLIMIINELCISLILR